MTQGHFVTEFAASKLSIGLKVEYLKETKLKLHLMKRKSWKGT